MHAVRKQCRRAVRKISGAGRNAQDRTLQDVTSRGSESVPSFCGAHPPPLNLYDAAPSDLADCFTGTPDFRPYELQSVAPELFDPAKAKEPLEPQPSPPIYDPRGLREQHRR